MNVLIVTHEIKRTPYGEEMDENSSSIFSLSCNINCKFVNLIRSLMLYTQNKLAWNFHLISLNVSLHNYTLILRTLNNDGVVYSEFPVLHVPTGTLRIKIAELSVPVGTMGIAFRV